jgi:hypothetical protein
VMQQRVGAGQRSARAEEHGQEEEGDEPALHERIIPWWRPAVQAGRRRGEADPRSAG